MATVSRSSADRKSGARVGDAFGPSPTPGITQMQMDSLPPSHTEVASVREFMTRLGAIRQALGLSYSELGTRAAKGFGKSTANRVLKDVDSLISEKHLKLYLRACHLAPADQERWLGAWRLVHRYTLKVVEQQERRVQTRDHQDNVIRLPTGIRQGDAAPADVTPLVHDNGSDDDNPSDDGTITASRPHPLGDPAPVRRPGVAVLRAVLTFSALIATSTGAVVAMWLVHLPPELIIATFGLVVVCMASWVAVYRVAILAEAVRERAQHAHGQYGNAHGNGRGPYPESYFDRERRRPRSRVVADPRDIFGDPLRASTPVIGIG